MKKQMALAMTALILTTCIPAYGDSAITKVQIPVTQFQSQGDMNLVSVREVCTLLGYPLTWSAEKRELSIKSTLGDFTIAPGVKSIRANGNSSILNTAPQIINGSLYIGADLVKTISGRLVTVNLGKAFLESPMVTNKESGAYTSDQLYEIAVKTDKTVKKAEIDLERIGVVLDRVETNFTTKPVTYGTSAEDQAALSATNSLESTRSNEQLLKNSYIIAKDSLDYKIRAAAEDILTGQGNIKYLDIVIKVTEKEVTFGMLKKELGTMSSYELTKLNTTLAGYKSKREMQRLAIENAYEKLNNMVGFEKTKRFEISNPMGVVEDKKINLDSKVAEILGISPAIGSLETAVSIAQNNTNYYVYNVNGTPYAAVAMDVDKAKLDLASAKQSLKRAVEELVINRESVFQQYQSVLNDKAQAEKDLSVAELNFKVGLISELDYQKAMLKLSELNQTELTTHVQLIKLDRTIDMPWISAS